MEDNFDEQVIIITCEFDWMVEPTRLEELYQFLSHPWETPRQASIYFQTVVCKEELPFSHLCSLNHLLLLNLLTIPQRILCLLILLAQPSNESQFISTILCLMERGPKDSFETSMIYQCWSKSNIARVLRELSELAEEHPLRVKVTEYLSKDMDVFKQNLKEKEEKQLPQAVKGRLYPIVCDYDLQEAPEKPLQKNSLASVQLQHEELTSFGPSFMRPVPEYIPISSSELVFLSPGIVFDLEYDFSGEFLALYERGQTSLLSKSQRGCFEQLLPSQIPNITSCPSDYIAGFCKFFSSNPSLGQCILSLLRDSQTLEYFYDKLINVDLNKQTLQTMKRIMMDSEVPRMTMNYYVIKSMQKCEDVEEGQREGLARLIVAMVRELIKGDRIDPLEMEPQIRSFGIRFSHIEDVAKFYKRIVQSHH